MSTVTLHSFDDPMKQHGDIGKNVRFIDDSIKNDSASDTTTVAEDEEDHSFVTGSSDITLQDEQQEQQPMEKRMEKEINTVKLHTLKSRFRQAFRLSSQPRRRRYVEPVGDLIEPPTCHMEHYHPAAAVPTLSYSVCGPGSKQRSMYQPPATPPPPPPVAPAPAVPKRKGILKKPPPPQPMQEPESSTSSSVIVSEEKPSVTRRRTWLNKIRSTMTPSSQQPHKNQSQLTLERKQTIRYNKMVIVHETYTRHEYNREPDPYASCAYLTVEAAQEIKNELNMFKFNEMDVHPASRIYTHFFI
ncbi:hypothetical protein BJV82DRAFT_655568 [Fennellomyces sp. T-0311]|nr:hypothetical protein BJV82DRAFT_655568 [Fennellomyces sp. T-0311]